jgi:hypothetical protein
VLSLDDLVVAAVLAAGSWREQEEILQGLGYEPDVIELVRVALAEHDAEAVARIVAGPKPD